MNKQFHGRKQLNEWLRFPLKKMQQKRGFAEGRILTDWQKIVGSALAAHCSPQKLTFPKGQQGATLHVLCDSGWAIEMQFQENVVCDKIATFFGYRAVEKIRIHQGILPAKDAPPPKRITAEPTAEVLQAVAQVQDEELKEALNRLALSRTAVSKVENKSEFDDTES